jgi:hypothetical protein
LGKGGGIQGRGYSWLGRLLMRLSDLCGWRVITVIRIGLCRKSWLLGYEALLTLWHLVGFPVIRRISPRPYGPPIMQLPIQLTQQPFLPSIIVIFKQFFILIFEEEEFHLAFGFEFGQFGDEASWGGRGGRGMLLVMGEECGGEVLGEELALGFGFAPTTAFAVGLMRQVVLARAYGLLGGTGVDLPGVFIEHEAVILFGLVPIAFLLIGY